VQMALVPAGCFMMGSDDGLENEQAIHEVCFEEPFWIDVTEVTFEQIGTDRCEDVLGLGIVTESAPCESVAFDEAQAYCEERGDAYLPTEAEWEYAARGPDGLIYPWGNAFDCSRGNFIEEGMFAELSADPGGVAVGCDGFMFSAPVGRFPEGASWVGALDMSGNAWEQVRDLDEPDSIMVLRGGAWTGGSDSARATYRQEFNANQSVSSGVGFRCARSYSP